MKTIAAILLLALLAWLWFENSGYREIATVICKKICQQISVQLLDDTIVLTRLRLKRDKGGQFAIQRTYRFEFTEDGNLRRQGNLLLIGKQLELIDIPDYWIEIVP